MIIPMRKLYAAVRAADRERLLERLRELGVVHLAPVDPEKARVDEPTGAAIQRLARALQVLEGVEPAGAAEALDAQDAADRALEIYTRSGELQTRLASLARQADRLRDWGEVRLETFQRLRESGLNVKFYHVPAGRASALGAACVETVGSAADGRDCVAAVFTADAEPPAAEALGEDIEFVELPERDRPSLRAEAAEIEKRLAADAEQLHRLARQDEAIRERLAELRSQAELTVARGGGIDAESIYAVQGWVPLDRAEGLADGLAEAGIEAGVNLQAPAEEELPPTLIRYPRWASPISALFKMLGTVPGYNEYDLSGFFMVAMPIFTAMLIGDAGYGLLMSLLPLLMWKKIASAAGRPAAALILIFGLVTLGWGVLTANYFGLTPVDIASKAGFPTVVDASGGLVTNGVAQMMDSDAGGLAAVGRLATSLGVFYRVDGDAGRNLIIMISFILGTVHLISAQLRQAVGKAPSITSLSHVGWGVFLVGMLGVIWMLFFPAAANPDVQWISPKGVVTLLGAGAALVVLFSFPSKNPVKTVGFGIVGNLLPMISTFSDTMSYIRLMAVGLASYYIAWAFNGMAMSIASAGVWAWGFTVVILLLGHGLNIFLALIAVLAHGVRLNMLEFSNNVGVQWYGYAYAPFGAHSK